MTEPATQQDQPDISTLSYEQAREELVMTVKRLETGNLPLEESLRLWERGEALADRCQSWLDGARERLDKAREETAEEGECAQSAQLCDRVSRSFQLRTRATIRAVRSLQLRGHLIGEGVDRVRRRRRGDDDVHVVTVRDPVFLRIVGAIDLEVESADSQGLGGHGTFGLLLRPVLARLGLFDAHPLVLGSDERHVPGHVFGVIEAVEARLVR